MEATVAHDALKTVTCFLRVWFIVAPCAAQLTLPLHSNGGGHEDLSAESSHQNMCRVHALAPHARTSLGTPLRAAERSVVAAAVAATAPRPLAMEPRPSLAMAATIERPVRLGGGID